MKKTIILFLAFNIFSSVVYAMGDTVRYGDSCYLFNPINTADCQVSRQSFLNYNPCAYYRHGCFMRGYEYILPTETTVYGVAATLFRIDENDIDSAGYTMLLYTIVNDKDLVCIDSITSYSRATYYMYSAMEGGEIINSAAPCYEYFFSTPHVLSGAVYLGARWVGNNDNCVTDPRCSAIDRNHNQHWINFFGDNTPPQYNSGLSAYWGGYFPIIQPERIGCGAAVAEVNERGEDYAVLAWDMDGDSCQLSVVPYNQPVDSAAVVDLTDNNYTATGLSTGIYYVARLRTQCHHRCHIHADTVVWSDWGAPTLFYVGEHEPDTGGVGIRHMEYSPEVSLTPNPAHGSATVQCEEGIRSVELLTVKGERIQCYDMAGEKTCTLDLGGLAKGLYIVQITTAQGTAARKLAVE